MSAPSLPVETSSESSGSSHAPSPVDTASTTPLSIPCSAPGTLRLRRMKKHADLGAIITSADSPTDSPINSPDSLFDSAKVEDRVLAYVRAQAAEIKKLKSKPYYMNDKKASEQIFKNLPKLVIPGPWYAGGSVPGFTPTTDSPRSQARTAAIMADVFPPSTNPVSSPAGSTASSYSATKFSVSSSDASASSSQQSTSSCGSKGSLAANDASEYHETIREHIATSHRLLPSKASAAQVKVNNAHKRIASLYASQCAAREMHVLAANLDSFVEVALVHQLRKKLAEYLAILLETADEEAEEENATVLAGRKHLKTSTCEEEKPLRKWGYLPSSSDTLEQWHLDLFGSELARCLT